MNPCGYVVRRPRNTRCLSLCRTHVFGPSGRSGHEKVWGGDQRLTAPGAHPDCCRAPDHDDGRIDHRGGWCMDPCRHSAGRHRNNTCGRFRDASGMAPARVASSDAGTPGDRVARERGPRGIPGGEEDAPEGEALRPAIGHVTIWGPSRHVPERNLSPSMQAACSPAPGVP